MARQRCVGANGKDTSQTIRSGLCQRTREEAPGGFFCARERRGTAMNLPITEAEFSDSAALGASEDIARSPWVVLKFGGTSVSSAESWATIAGLVRNRLAAELKPLVVHSALQGVSNKLLAALQAAAAGERTGLVAEIPRAALPARTATRCRRSRPAQRDPARTRTTHRRRATRARSQRTRPRAHHGARRTHGDAARRRIPEQGRDPGRMARCARPAHQCQQRRRPAFPRLPVRQVRVVCRRGHAGTSRGERQGHTHAGLHRAERVGRDRHPRPRRLGHVGRLLRRPARGAAPGNLDGRSRHVHRESARGAVGAPAVVSAFRRSPGVGVGRQLRAAPALPVAGARFRHPAVHPLHDATATSRALSSPP